MKSRPPESRKRSFAALNAANFFQAEMVGADLTRGKGGFNTPMGLFATALAVCGVLGPLISGLLGQHLGFRFTFYAFAAPALAGACLYATFVPETRREQDSR